jgi:hypothetical protein
MQWGDISVGIVMLGYHNPNISKYSLSGESGDSDYPQQCDIHYPLNIPVMFLASNSTKPWDIHQWNSDYLI